MGAAVYLKAGSKGWIPAGPLEAKTTVPLSCLVSPGRRGHLASGSQFCGELIFVVAVSVSAGLRPTLPKGQSEA
jgi:hypothetical protein